MRATVQNYPITYTDEGDGLPLLLIHGFPLSRQMWQPQIDGLSGQMHLIAPDLPGFGESVVIPGNYWMDRLAQTVSAFLDSIHINDPVVVCGLSMGGYIALEFYRQFSPRMAGLVLASTRHTADSEEARKNRDKAIEKVRAEGVEAVVEDMLPKMMSPKTFKDNPDLVESVRQMMNQTSAEGMAAALQGMRDRRDNSILIGQIEMPVLVLYGEDDQLVSRKEAEALAEGISHGRLVTIPDSGHLLNMEQPEAFNHAILEYKKEISS